MLQGENYEDTIPVGNESDVHCAAGGAGGVHATIDHDDGCHESSIAPGASDATQTLALGNAGTVYSVSTNVAAWVRIYATSAAQTADAGRTSAPGGGGYVAPTRSTGLIFEGLLEGTNNVVLSPVAGYADLAGSPTGNFAVTVYNESASTTSTITVTLKKVNSV